MNRLTDKEINYIDLYYRNSKIDSTEIRRGIGYVIADKLQKFEDLFEKYEIENLTELEIALDQYYHRADNVQTRRVDKNE